MNRKPTFPKIFHSATILLPAVLLCACATSEKAVAEAPAGDESARIENAMQSATPFDRTLLDIVRDQDKIFGDMESGRIQEEDFKRKLVNLSFRYDELISRNPDDVNTLILYGKFLRRIGQTEQANTMFVHADHLSPNIAVVKQQIGNYLAEQGSYPQALSYYVEAVNLEPNMPVYHYGIGELLATFGTKIVEDGVLTDAQVDDQMLTAFAKAAELDPSNKSFAFRHGEAYYDLKTPRWQEALALWEKIGQRSDLTPTEQDAVRLHKARMYCELYEDNKALELLKEDVAPLLRATRTRLLKRISEGRSLDEDKTHAQTFVPEAVGASDTPQAPTSSDGESAVPEQH